MKLIGVAMMIHRSRIFSRLTICQLETMQIRISKTISPREITALLLRMWHSPNRFVATQIGLRRGTHISAVAIHHTRCAIITPCTHQRPVMHPCTITRRSLGVLPTSGNTQHAHMMPSPMTFNHKKNKTLIDWIANDHFGPYRTILQSISAY